MSHKGANTIKNCAAVRARLWCPLDMGGGAFQKIDCAFAMHFPFYLGLWKLFHEEICSFWDCTHAGAAIVHYWA